MSDKEPEVAASPWTSPTDIEIRLHPGIPETYESHADKQIPDSHLRRPEEDNYGNRGVFQGDENLSSPFITDDFRSSVPAEKDHGQSTGSTEHQSCSLYDKQTTNSDDTNVKEGQREPGDNLESELVNKLLHSSSVEKKGISNIQPCYIQESRTMSVNFFKPTGFNQPRDPSADPHFENRHIFEAGGEESLNLRGNRLRGILHAGGDEIEYLQEETPERQVFITPATPSEQESNAKSWTSRLNKFFLPVKVCFRFLWKKFEEQFAKAPLFYLLSTVTAFIGGITHSGTKEDSDIVICLVTTLAVCVVITILVPRGQWAKSVEQLENLFHKDSKNIQPSICSAFRGRHEPRVERHSKHYHPKKESDTTFEHEIADVSNIDSEECPQIRMVEQRETTEPGSSDYPPDLSRVNASIHASRTSEELGAISKLRSQAFFKKSAKSHHKSTKFKISSAPLKLPKNVKAEVHFPETVSKPTGVYRGGHASAMAKFPHAPESLRTHFDFSPKLTEASHAKAFDKGTAHNREEFVCEHYGQGYACSCCLDIPGKN